MATSQIINELTGGTEYVPGAWSPTPDQLDYLIGQVTGGVGREARKTWDTAELLTSGETPPSYKVPMLGRLYGDAGGESSYSNRFYELVKQSNMHVREIEGRARNGGDYIQYLEDTPEARGAEAVVEAASMVSEARRYRREAEKAGRSKEEIAKLDRAINSIMRKVVEAENAASRQ